MKQLNVAGAHCAVILPTVKDDCNNGAYQEARLDADVILTYQHLTAISPGLDIFMDINSGANLAFLIPHLKCKSGTTRELIDTPLVASGTVFLSGFLDSLFCQVKITKTTTHMTAECPWESLSFSLIICTVHTSLCSVCT